MNRTSATVAVLLLALLGSGKARAEGDLGKVKHIIIVMQENHSFDNYFGALPYAPGSPYHGPGHSDDNRDREHEHDDQGCREGDHRCVDGLSCSFSRTGNLVCADSNRDEGSFSVRAFHDSRRCVSPDLDHSWFGTHREVNYFFPNWTRWFPRNDGYVRVNDVTEQPDSGGENPTEDQTMAFYNQDEIPFYYGLAERFAISDRYFSSVLGPTFPNRSYLTAATSFGHLTTSDTFPPPGGYKPITGTIFDLLDQNQVSWADYFQDAPQGATFRLFGATGIDPHFFPLPVFLAQAAGAPTCRLSPRSSFVDPNFGLFAIREQNDEHPPTDIQRGQAFVSQVVNAVRNGPYWKDTVIFITYDEHGGFYDHVPAAAGPAGPCADAGRDRCRPVRGPLQSARQPAARRRSGVREQLPVGHRHHARQRHPALPSSGGQSDRAIPRALRELRPARRPRPVHRRLAILQAALRVAHRRGPHLAAGVHREAVPQPRVGEQPLHLTRRDEHADTLRGPLRLHRAPSLGHRGRTGRSAGDGLHSALIQPSRSVAEGAEGDAAQTSRAPHAHRRSRGALSRGSARTLGWLPAAPALGVLIEPCRRIFRATP